jgi:hypothetical protein
VSVDATVIGAIFTGLSAVLVAYTQLRAQRSGSSRRELRRLRRENRRLENQMLGVRRWGLRCEVRLIEERVKNVPRRPAEFDLDWGREADEDEEEPAGGSKRLKLVSR